jgi:uncharacterized protein YpuA (DUF1002 family)
MDHLLKIVGKTYTLSLVDQVDDQDSLGECNDVLQRILVKSGQKPDQLMDTILHEVVHAVDYQMHLGLTERQVHAVAAGLTAVFLDNPDFCKLWNRSNIESSNWNLGSMTMPQN